jgi:hypothetical protein
MLADTIFIRCNIITFEHLVSVGVLGKIITIIKLLLLTLYLLFFYLLLGFSASFLGMGDSIACQEALDLKSVLFSYDCL